MQTKIRTHVTAGAVYLIVTDDEGAEASLLVKDGETIEQCLMRHIREEKYKADAHGRRATRMQAWLDSFAIA